MNLTLESLFLMGERQPWEAVVVLKERRYHGRLEDVLGYQARLSFPCAKGRLVMEMGAKTRLALRRADIDRALYVNVIVRSAVEAGSDVLYAVRMPEPGETEAQLDRGMLRAFDRRLTPRVSPRAEAPIKATLDTRGGAVRRGAGQVRDISAGGLAIALSARDDRVLSSFTLFRLRFSLPGSKTRFELLANLVRRRLVNAQVRFGVSFVDANDRAYDDVMDALDDYMLRLERQDLTLSKHLG